MEQKQTSGYPELMRMVKAKTLKNALSCAYINVNGLCKKLDEIKILLNETKFDVLPITDTHLSKNYEDTELYQPIFLSKK